MAQVIPTFLLGGAPKSGTTALANYLREHPSIFFARTKEPFYWASDLPAMRQAARVDSEDAYLHLFADAKPEHLAVGEGTTLYLYSDCAIRNAIQWNSNFKFVFMLRRPEVVAHAFHMQMKFHEFEDIADFQQAWEAQERRRTDLALIPSRCREPRLLQYGRVASVGSQLKRAMEQISPENRLVLLFDDFTADTRSTYLRVLDFLGVKDDGRTSFPQENAAMVAKHAGLTRMMRMPAVVAATDYLKKRLKGGPYAIARSAKHSLMLKSSPRSPLDDRFQSELLEWFVPEVELVESLLGRDLSAWKKPIAKKPTT